MQRQIQTKEKTSHCGSLVSYLVQELAIQLQTPVRVTILKVTQKSPLKMAIVLYVHSVMCYKDLRATINPYYKPKISEES